MSADEVLEQVKALPPRERRKFFECVHELETTIDSQPNGKGKRKSQGVARDHSTFLNSYAPQDEGLYDDAAAR